MTCTETPSGTCGVNPPNMATATSSCVRAAAPTRNDACHCVPHSLSVLLRSDPILPAVAFCRAKYGRAERSASPGKRKAEQEDKGGSGSGAERRRGGRAGAKAARVVSGPEQASDRG
jgi:hypothetical protein